MVLGVSWVMPRHTYQKRKGGFGRHHSVDIWAPSHFVNVDYLERTKPAYFQGGKAFACGVD